MEYKARHLEMIQQVINRMANNCLNIKGWLIAIITAGFIFISKEYSRYGILVSLVLIIGFSFFDAKYLQYERKYRELYKIICESEKTDFSMNINREDINSIDKCKYKKCYLSISILLPYFVLTLYVAILFVITYINI